MNKILKYTVMIFTAAFFMMSCEKNVLDYDVTRDSSKAYVQLLNQIPFPVGTEYNFYKAELNGVDVCHNGNALLNSWSFIPSGSVGAYYETPAGQASIKLYQGANRVLKYDQTIQLKEGKQGLILYDLTKPPIVIDEPDYYIIDRTSYYTDTITYIRFFNLMREKIGVESNLKLQYQYQYVYNPIYTEADELAGKIPAGSKLGDAVPAANRIRSPWINLGAPVGFGEDTGWQIVPVKKETWLTQGSARVDYRALVTQGGVVGVNMTANGVLICRTSRSASALTMSGYSDWWTGYIGRRQYHLFSGYRDDIPGMEIATAWIH